MEVVVHDPPPPPSTYTALSKSIRPHEQHRTKQYCSDFGLGTIIDRSMLTSLV